jgi:hypothetical protein
VWQNVTKSKQSIPEASAQFAIRKTVVGGSFSGNFSSSGKSETFGFFRLGAPHLGSFFGVSSPGLFSASCEMVFNSQQNLVHGHLGSTVVAAASGALRTHQVMRRNIIFRRAKQNRTKTDLNDWPRRKLCVPTTAISFAQFNFVFSQGRTSFSFRLHVTQLGSTG